MMKYRNKKTDVDGYTFDSKLEAARYIDLKMLLASGEISDLQIHPSFCLLDKFKTDTCGRIVSIRAIHYEGDFSYKIPGNPRVIVEDTKGFLTEAFKLKEKLFRYKFGQTHDLRLVRATGAARGS